MSSDLADLPSEILSQVVSHVEHARTLLHLSLTCRRLNEYVQVDGFRVFVQSRFPSFRVQGCWKDAAHSLTNLSRAWDRRAFVGRYTGPGADILWLPPDRGDKLPPHALYNPASDRTSQPSRHQRGMQTMGFRPVLDCYEQRTGDSWASKEEVLAFGAGAELMLRVTKMGPDAEKAWQSASTAERQRGFNQHHHREHWIRWKESSLHDGKDDITSLNLLKPLSKTDGQDHNVIVGRASGLLERLTISSDAAIATKFLTAGRPVQSAHVSDTLLAACLSSNTVVLYPLHSNQTHVDPLEELSIVTQGRLDRTWTTRFLRPDRLAVGHGSSKEPLDIYEIRPDGIIKERLRGFPARGTCVTPSGEHGVLGKDMSASVYCVLPLPAYSQASGSDGTCFLSGRYEGNIWLHDLRSSKAWESIYWDPVDPSSPIYSLLGIGCERLVAGSARHCTVKIFDLRMPGARLYHAADIGTQNSLCQLGTGLSQARERSKHNIFLDNQHYRTKLSPVYSLASASSSSLSFYAGLEANVMQIDVMSILDKHPDPVHKYGWNGPTTQVRSAEAKFNPQGDMLYFGMTGHSRVGSELYHQVPFWTRMANPASSVPGLDQRWQSRSRRQDGVMG